MLGSIIGDIVGSRWEFDPTNDYDFEWLSDKNSFTDDTICTVAVADALLHNRDFGESIHDWCNRYPHPKGGYGGRFITWVMSDHPKPYNSYGNGACMRVSPIGYWFNNELETLDAAAASAIVSHNHDEGVKGAQTVALAIRKAIEYNAHYLGAARHIDDIIDECIKFSGYNINMTRRSVLNVFDETSQGTVPVALKIISISKNFEDAIRLAVSLGGDADTLGAIVGGIAESIWGVPSKIRRQVRKYLPNEMLSIIDDFYYSIPHYPHQLIDETFSNDTSMDVPMDLLEQEEKVKQLQEKCDLRMLMEKRAKAREQW